MSFPQVERMNEVCDELAKLLELDELDCDEVSLMDELFDELIHLQREMFAMLDLDSVEVSNVA